MKIKKLLCIFSLILSLSMLSILKVEAEEDKVIEVTLPTEKITETNWVLRLTYREFYTIQNIMAGREPEGGIFYNPITNQHLFELHYDYDENSFYMTPFTDIVEEEFTFSIPDEWYNNAADGVESKFFEGYDKIKISFDALPSDTTTEIVLDFTKAKDMLDLPYVYNINPRIFFLNRDYPITGVYDDEKNEDRFINSNSEKVLAIINGDDYSITIPDDVSYEDNISFDVELDYLTQIKKLSYIFGKEPENDEDNIPTQDEDNINNIDTNPTTYNNEIVLLVLGGCLLCSIATITKSKRKIK